ncbi:MAG TPA: GTPase ObgE [Candidatus Acidoferrales bacterium]|nr:GTPase ObgE [Candidatus Acidoferrales bacterium]
MASGERDSYGRFVDSALIQVRAGRGGRGAASFRREPYVPRGGPDGGDGGRGGSVILTVSSQAVSLVAYRTPRLHRAADGEPGRGGLKSGRSGADLRLPVPPGTLVLDANTGDVIADLMLEGEEAVVSRGGGGGRGNVHFKSSVHRSPELAEPGRAGQERELRLDLKLIADAGLIGAPNAGKSSLLRAMSNATPKVGAYPFTTLDPELGVTELAGGNRMTVADIPGLVEGAAQGVGLGLRFLRHVERTRVLVCVLDGAAEDPLAQLKTIRRELLAYSPVLAGRPQLVVVNKLDLPEVAALRAGVGGEFLWCSALTGEGVPELVTVIESALIEAPVPARAPVAPVTHLPRRRRQERPPVTVTRQGSLLVLAGEPLERLLERTDLNSAPSLERFQLRLDQMGVSELLEEAGAKPGDSVRVGEVEFEFRP